MEKVPCPFCKTLSSWKNNPTRPFCSERCKNADLGKWANEEYRVPVEEMDSGAQGSEHPAKKEPKEED